MNQIDIHRNNYLHFIKQFFVFILLLICFQLIGSIFSLIYSQAALFLAVNRLHNDTADEIFMLITHLGDWPVTFGIAILCLFIRFKYSLVLLATMLYTGFFTQVIKLIVQHPRPSIYFENITPIYTIKNYVLQNSLSFPSGHTTCVFSLAITLSYIMASKNKQALFFLIALIVALSRVYLSQHFFKDLLAGSLIGTFFALHLLWLFERSNWYHSPLLKKNIMTIRHGNKSVS